MKKISFITLVLCIILSLSACTDYKSQIEELQTTISKKDDTIAELESELSDCKALLEDANNTIEEQEITINELNDQLYDEENYDDVSDDYAYDSESVYVTKTGTKYHQSWCSYLRSSCYSMTLDDAIFAGYTPCSRCY